MTKCEFLIKPAAPTLLASVKKYHMQILSLIKIQLLDWKCLISKTSVLVCNLVCDKCPNCYSSLTFQSSTWREIKAVELTLLSFKDALKGSSVTCCTDSQNAASDYLKGK
jgi:hypothetical protein